MDFWRAYRVLGRRKWAILTAVLLTTGLTALLMLTVGRKYDARTRFGPTDQAVRNSVLGGNEDRAGGDQIIVNEDTRTAEARRIADGVTSSDNVAAALTYLSRAPGLRARLISELSAAGAVTTGLNSAKSYQDVKEAVERALGRLTAQVGDIESETGVPKELWADFVYLSNLLREDPKTQGDMSWLNDEGVFLRVFNQAEKGIERVKARDVIFVMRDANKTRAEVLASALTAAYKYTYDKDKLSIAKANLDYYTKAEAKALEEFKLSQARLRDHRIKNRTIYHPDQKSATIKMNEDAKAALDNIDASLRDFDAQIAASRARLASIPKMIRKTTKSEDPTIAALRDRITTLRSDLAVKSGIYTENYPDVVRLKSQLAAAEAEYKKVQGSMYSTATLVDNDEYLEREREIARMLQSRKGLAAKKATLEAVIAKTDATLAKLPVAETEADTLARDYAAKSDRYTEVRRGLNQAIQDVEQAKAGNLLVVASWAGPNGQTMNHPEIPAFPGAQKTTIASIMAALLLSLLGSSLVFLAMDYLDTSVRDSKDVERILDVPVNGVVPRLPAEQKALMAKITDSLPASPHAEAYRFLGTDILLSAAESPFKTVMVATAKPNQGGTSTICNLAITLAQAGQSVALVDADLRRPSLHHVFNVPNDQGLSTVLANGKLPGDVLQRTEVENLYVMTGGPIPENAWKLLRSPKMKDVISDLQRDFDFVLFDTPSAAVFADAATLATMVDGVLLVVRAQEQPSGSEMQVKNLLNKTRARIVGVVLNDVPLTQVDSARYFEEYYGDGHKTEAVAAAASGRPALPQRASDDEI